MSEETTEQLEEATEVKNRTLAYFAADGNYGNAAGLTVMETTNWEEVDWEIIEATSDEHRPAVSKLITESYENREALIELKTKFLEYGIDLDDFIK